MAIKEAAIAFSPGLRWDNCILPGDTVRVGGLHYTCNPTRKIGRRISNMTLAGQSIEADKRFKVASWPRLAKTLVANRCGM